MQLNWIFCFFFFVLFEQKCRFIFIIEFQKIHVLSFHLLLICLIILRTMLELSWGWDLVAYHFIHFTYCTLLENELKILNFFKRDRENLCNGTLFDVNWDFLSSQCANNDAFVLILYIYMLSSLTIIIKRNFMIFNSHLI